MPKIIAGACLARGADRLTSGDPSLPWFAVVRSGDLWQNCLINLPDAARSDVTCPPTRPLLPHINLSGVADVVRRR
jgi:hypothetical protein